MNLIKCSSINKNRNTALIISLVLILGYSSNIFAEEKPLGTIGEPQLNKIQTEKPANNKPDNSKFVPDNEITSPFSVNTTAPDTSKNSSMKLTPGGITTDTNKPSNTVRITPDGITPEISEPKVEEIKTPGNTANAAQSAIIDPKNPLGLAQPYNLLDQSLELLKKNDVAKAKSIVEPLTDWLTTLTEYHIQLFKRLNDIETAKNQAQVEKRLALDAALLRDKAYYQLGLIYLAEKDNKKAIKYLIEVIKSQPKTELGMKSYEILQQIGFTEKIRLIP